MSTAHDETRPDGVTTTAVDATALLRASAIHAHIFPTVPIGSAVVDRACRFAQVNAAMAAITGLPIEAHIGHHVGEIAPWLWQAMGTRLEAVLRDGVAQHATIHGVASDAPASTRAWLVNLSPVRDGDDVIGVAVMTHDVTEVEQVRDALRLRTELYAMISRTNRAVVERRSATQLFDDVCRIAVETGHFRFAWIGVPVGSVLDPVARAGEDDGYLASVLISVDEADPHSHGPSGRAAITARTYVVNDFFASPMTTPWHEAARRVGFGASASFPILEGGRVAAVLTLYATQAGFFTPELIDTLNEVTPSISFAMDAFAQERERLRSDAALRLRDRAILAVSQGICITDPRQKDNPIIFASPGFERMTGYAASEAIGRNCRFLQGPGSDAATLTTLRESIAAGRGCTVEVLNYRQDGTAFWNELTLSPVFDDAGTLTNFVGVQTDVTARRQLEHQIRQGQKMEAVGQLASGVAHDFNNLLTIIDGCSELLLEALPPDDPLRELASDIRTAGERGGTLTRQLLAFGRKQLVAPRVLDLNACVVDSEKLLRRLIGDDVLLTTKLAPSLWPVNADPGQIEQVLINLAVNARDAMPDGGRIIVSTHNLSVTDRSGTLAAGDYVVLQVADTGVGMDDTTRAMVFEPFFTTKVAGKGTGLGLSTVHSIIEQAHGQILLESAPGRGTSFRICLPRDHTAVAETSARRAQTSMPRGTESLLLVEDDSAVRALGSQVLRSCGYTVHEAPDGEAALEFARTHTGPIHLLVSDVVMPYLGGRLLAEALRTIRTDCRVLFVSGYTDDDVLRHGVVESEVAFLQKPYTPVSLAQAVRSALDAGAPGAR